MNEDQRHEQTRKQFEYYLKLAAETPTHFREPMIVDSSVELHPIEGWRFFNPSSSRP